MRFRSFAGGFCQLLKLPKGPWELELICTGCTCTASAPAQSAFVALPRRLTVETSLQSRARLVQ